MTKNDAIRKIAEHINMLCALHYLSGGDRDIVVCNSYPTCGDCVLAWIDEHCANTEPEFVPVEWIVRRLSTDEIEYSTGVDQDLIMYMTDSRQWPPRRIIARDASGNEQEYELGLVRKEK